MSECVVRIEFRKNCLDCDLHQIMYGGTYADTDVYCFKEKRFVGKRFGPDKDLARPSWCPILCQLPDGHGRLIDWDAFERIGFKLCRKTNEWKAELGTPTNESYVVPAERNET